MSDSKTPILSMDYKETTLEDIFLALTDDNVYPDEDGNLPSIEEILSNRERFSDEVEDESDEADDGEYKPLFSSSNDTDKYSDEYEEENEKEEEEEE